MSLQKLTHWFSNIGTAATRQKNLKRRRKPGRRLLLSEQLENRRLMVADLVHFLTQEHADINIQHNSGEWKIGPRDATAERQYANDEAVMYVGSPALIARPSGASFEFVGVPTGENFYLLPSSQDPDVLFLGIAAYGVEAASLDRYQPTSESKGRVTSNQKWIKASLAAVRHTTPDGAVGSGVFSAWQSGSFGAPTVFMSSYNDSLDNPDANGLDVTDGVTADDALWIIAGGHAHFNYGFSKPGRYEVDLKLSAYFGDDGLSTPNTGGFSSSEEITLYFSVVSAGQLEVDESSYSVNEDAGTISIDVVRVGGSDGRITVDYATVDGSAGSGSDFVATSGTLEFLDGDKRKTVTIGILNDEDEESNETFNLALSNPQPDNLNDYVTGVEGDANGILGSISTSLITIMDNDQNTPPSISDISDQVTDEDVSTSAIAFVVGDTRTPAADLVVTASSDNLTIVPISQIVLGGNGANRTVTITPAENQFGSATITLTVTDAGGLAVTDSFVLTVNSVNDAPKLSQIANQATPVSTPTEAIAFTIDDIETAADDLAISITSSDTTLVPNDHVVLGGSGANRTLIVTPAVGLSGFTTITVRVSDQEGLASERSFVLAVGDVNQPPTISEISEQLTKRNTSTPFITFTVSDAETAPENLLITATSSNAALVPDEQIVIQGSGENRTVTVTPNSNLSGTAVITLTVTDNGGKQVSESFVLTVNDPPNISDIPNQIVVQNYSTAPLPFTIGDAETIGDELILSVTSSNLELLPISNIVFGGTAASRTVMLTPAADFVGSSEIVITVTDTLGQQSSSSFVVSVVDGGVGAVADQFTLYGFSKLQASVTLNDLWHSSLGMPTTTIEELPAHGTVVLLENGAFTYTPGITFAGSDRFTYRLTHVGGDSTAAEVSIMGAELPEFNAILLSGHADIGLAIGAHGHDHGGMDEEPEWDLHVHDGENDIEYHADEALLFVGNQAKTIREGSAADPAYDFLGVAPGDYFFVLPEAENPDLIFLGIGTEEIEAGTLLAGEARLQLVAVNGPGEFSIWNSGSISPVVRMATADGISGDDTLMLTEASHSHFNYAFSVAGEYQVTFLASGFLADGTEIHGEEVTYFFRVGNENPIATNEAFDVSSGNILSGNVSLNDYDSDSDPVSISLLADATHGALTLQLDGSFVYVPASTFAGMDSFSYRIDDPFLGSSEAVVTIQAAAQRTFIVNLMRGHVDIGLALGNHASGHDGEHDYEQEWDLHIHDEETDSEYHPDEARLFVGNEALMIREGNAADPAFDFLGVSTGESIYVLAENENPDLLFLGIGAEEIESGTLLDGTARLQLVAVNGPGEFSIWKSGSLQPDVRMATSDGIDGDDFITVFEGNHAHYNFAFSKPGDYEITFQARSLLADGTELISDYTTYFFRVANDLPIAQDDSFTVEANSGLQGNVLFNDTDPNFDTLSVELVNDVNHGGLTFRQDGSFVYLPSSSFTGSDSFTYRITDEFEGSSTATVLISASPIRDFEVTLLRGHADIGLGLGGHEGHAENEWDLHVHDEENDIEYHADEVLLFVGNDAEVVREGFAADPAFDFLGAEPGESFWVLPETENPDLLFLGIGAEEISSGTLLDGKARLQLISVSGPGDFSIWNSGTPQPVVRMATSDGIGGDDFIHVMEASHAHFNYAFSAVGSYEITFQAMGTRTDGTEIIGEYTTFFFRVGNNAPVAGDDAFAVTPGNTLFGNVLRNDFDPNGDTLTPELLVAPTKGSVVLQPNGTFKYLPSPSFEGADSFSYTLADSFEGTVVGNVTISQSLGQDFEARLGVGHVDIGLAFGEHHHDGGDEGDDGGHEEPEWDLHVHDEASDTEYHPDEVQLLVNATARKVRTGDASNSNFDFLGVAQGEAFYVLPEVENVNQLFLGIAGEEVELGTWMGGMARLQFISVNGPGEFAIWNNLLSGPVVHVATSDGLTDEDFVTVLEGSHAHYNYAFSQLGTYEITVQATATLSNGEIVTSELVTYYFRVANLEPTLTAVKTLSLEEDADLQTIDLADIGSGIGEVQELRITVSSDNTGLIPTTSLNYLSGASEGTLQFTPAANQSGTATIALLIEDAGFDGDFATSEDNAQFLHTIEVEVRAINDTPTLAPLSPRILPEDAGLQTVSFAGVSAGGGEFQPLRVMATSSNPGLIPHPDVNYLTPQASGTLTFTPISNQSGTATITVWVEDGGLDNDLNTVTDNGSFSQSFLVTVNAVNDSPTLDVIQDIIIGEDAAEQMVNLTGVSAGGGESQPLRLVVTSSNTELVPTPNLDYISPSSTGTIRFTPVANRFGTAVITVTITDGGLDNNLGTPSGNLSLTRTFLVTVSPVNDQPVAGDDSYQLFINNTSELDVLQNDSDVEDSRNNLFLEVVTQPSGGTVTVHDGQFRFVPNLTLLGADSFTYRVRDTEGLASEPAVVELLLQELPQTNSDIFWTAKNQSFTADVLANDVQLVSSLNLSTLTLSNVSPSGTAVVQNGVVQITPAPGYVGSISFTYTVSNQLGIVSPATSVVVNVLNRSFQNPLQRFDVNGDRYVTAIDALIIINELNRRGPRALDVLSDFAPPYFDVNGDYFINASDALSVINHLNAQQFGSTGGAGEAEGEGDQDESIDSELASHRLWSKENRLQDEVDAALVEMLAEDHLRRQRVRTR